MNKTVQQLAAAAREGKKIKALSVPPDGEGAIVKPKKKKRLSINKLVMDWMRANGWIIGLVESTIPHTFIKRDLFGFVDMIAAGHGQIIGLQVCARCDTSKRINKARELDTFKTFVTAAPFYVVGVDLVEKTTRFKIIRVTEESDTEIDAIPRASQILPCPGCGFMVGYCVC